MTRDIETYLEEKAALVNGYLEAYWRGPVPSVPDVLLEAMRYSLLAGGKRLRPVLALASYEVCGGRAEDVLGCAAALEAIHTYSLIHDDLPAMDNDDLRRGKPTNHKVFGEAVAILAGDGLLSEAFLMMLDAEGIGTDRVLAGLREVALAAGPRGMVGGQVQDILSESAEPDPETLRYIHEHKTGALIAASVRLGAILAGAGEAEMGALSAYGRNLGLAFQIIDDILDVRGDASVMGKPVGSDQDRHKMTYPALYGIDESMRRAAELIAAAVEAVEPLGGRAEHLGEIARYMLRRTH
ncbi:MAG: polyprenyl synthetase family protein [Nitrospirota bacterium]